MEHASLVVVIDHADLASNPWVTVQGALYTEPPDVPDRALIVADELGAEGWQLRTSVSFDLPGDPAGATFVAHTFVRETI